jgi:hypothetical protein
MSALNVTVTIIDVNDPPVFVPAAFTVPERSAFGTVVYQLASSDEDRALHGDPASYAMANPGGSASAFLAVDLNGRVTVSATLNWETDPRDYELHVVVTDAATPPASVSGTAYVQLVVRLGGYRAVPAPPCHSFGRLLARSASTTALSRFL